MTLTKNVESNDGAAPGGYSEPRTSNQQADDAEQAVVARTYFPERLGSCPRRSWAASDTLAPTNEH